MLNERIRKNARKKRRWKQTATIISMTFLFLILIFAGYYFVQLKKTADQAYKEIDRETIPSNEVASLKDPFTVLAMGIEGLRNKSGQF